MPLPSSFDISAFTRPKKPRLDRWQISALVGAAVLSLLLLSYGIFIRVPSDFQPGTQVVIQSGWGISSTADALYESHVIRSPFLFKAFMVLFGGEHSIIAGSHVFAAPENVIQIAWKFSHDNQEFALVRLTIPEGTTIKGIERLMPKEFVLFDPVQLSALAEGKEGYLFPDTYYLSSDIDAAEVYRVLTQNFIKKTAPEKAESASLGKSFPDMITIASILEAEANDDQSRAVISGIIQHRLKLGMPLQADSTLRYVTGRTSAELTGADLRLDSPYNTYNRRGLPPTPIDNPGLAAIDAAIHPKATNYLYFLSDKNGNMHYAATLAEHDANIKKYLQ